MARGRKKATTVVDENQEMNMEEQTNMENQELVQQEEFQGATQEAVNTEVENNEASLITVDAEGKKIYHDMEGAEITCSAFCRMIFETQNLTKKQISDKYDIPYRTVYGACQNLTNDATGTRSRVPSTVKVNADGKVLVAGDEGHFLLDGEDIGTSVDMTAFSSVDRDTWVKEQFANGVERADIAKKLNVSHGVIYNITKDMGDKRGAVMITLEDGTSMKRVEYIRNLYENGQSRADIAKLLDIPYNVVYQATKEDKSVAEKLKAAIDAVAKFKEGVKDQEAFGNAITVLYAAEVVEAEKEEAEATAEQEASTEQEATQE